MFACYRPRIAHLGVNVPSDDNFQNCPIL